MSDRDLTYQDLLQIVELIKSSSQFSEFHLKVGDMEIDLRRNDAKTFQPDVSETGSALGPNSSPVPLAGLANKKEAREDRAHEAHQRHGHVGGGEVVMESEAVVVRSGVPPNIEQTDFPPDSILIRSPMVGTFYRAPEPGASPFVEVGQRVTSESVVCIIEVMKLMNSICAEHSGVVTHILVQDGEPVEFGQVLIVVGSGD